MTAISLNAASRIKKNNQEQHINFNRPWLVVMILYVIRTSEANGALVLGTETTVVDDTLGAGTFTGGL